MEEEAEQLLNKISMMTNSYGIAARHYINKNTALNFIISIHREIAINDWDGNEDFKNDIINFVEKYDILNSKIENQ
jgi:hypothetical protein